MTEVADDGGVAPAAPDGDLPEDVARGL